MSHKATRSFVISFFVAAALFAAKNANADEFAEASLESKVKELLIENKIFEKADRLSVYLKAGDDSFFNIDSNAMESLVRERFADDRESLAGDSWNMEAGESKNWTYVIDDDDERFVLRSKALIHSDGFKGTEASEKEIYKAALNDLNVLGLQNSNDLELDIRRLMLTTLSEDGKADNKAVAYKVFVYRKIGDVLVRGPRTVITYLNDGRLQKILMKWPAVEKGSVALQRTKSDKDIVSLVSKEIRKNGMADAENMKADISYVVRDGKLRIVTVVTGRLQGPDDSHFLRDIEVEI